MKVEKNDVAPIRKEIEYFQSIGLEMADQLRGYFAAGGDSIALAREASALILTLAEINSKMIAWSLWAMIHESVVKTYGDNATMEIVKQHLARNRANFILQHHEMAQQNVDRTILTSILSLVDGLTGCMAEAQDAIDKVAEAALQGTIDSSNDEAYEAGSVETIIDRSVPRFAPGDTESFRPPVH